MLRVFSLLICLLSSFASSHSLHAEDELHQVGDWRFGTEETFKVTTVGGVQRDQPGPRPPEFPDFDGSNTSVKLDGKGSRLEFKDTGASSDFDFDNGDAITIEAWINVSDSLGDDRNVYVVGKGRTGDRQFAADNQNWALRLRSIDGLAHVSFLFATDKKTSKNGHWHRWTSNEGFQPGTGWHRIAVRYEFGKPESIAGWLNDKRLEGKWDMGGKTTEPPVVDDDAVWIGSALSGGAANSFKGMLDEISVFRRALSDEQLSKRFRRDGPDRNKLMAAANTPPNFQPIAGAVAVRIFEGLAAHDRWSVAETYESNKVYEFALPNMLFHRLPFRYDPWGIRASWRPTVLLQAVADVRLPAGQHQLLLRGRGRSRVWLNDKTVATFGARTGATDGHNPVEPLPNPPAADHRLLQFGDQEAIATLDISVSGIHRLALETLVGSNKSRSEPGETLVALRLDGESDFQLVQSCDSQVSAVALKDPAIAQQRNQLDHFYESLNHRNRREASATQDPYWQKRREIAARWLEQHPAPPVPAANAVQTEQNRSNPIDRFLDAKIATAQAETNRGHDAKIATAQAETNRGHDPAVAHFHEEVMPILRENCLRCHADRAEGGLRLTSREQLLKGGDSGSPAITPGKPDASELLARVRSSDKHARMPPSSSLSVEQQATLEKWIVDGANWGRVVPQEALIQPAIVDDAAFLRRSYLDTCGVPPTETETRQFIADTNPEKRSLLIQQLLNDPHLADHWVSYWQDVLAENPNFLKPSLNNTGPFRFFLHEAILDHKPIDRLVTELILLRGSEREGGSAGFGMAADNDSPLATRSIVLASAFLGINMQCARCHDSPYHTTTQQDLFATASMLARKPLSVPPSSSVAPGFFDTDKGRQALIQVTLKPGVPVEPQWCFARTTGVSDCDEIAQMMSSTDDSRERLAALITAPHNERFAAVIVNRIWKRLMGAGIVEPADDWENHPASHPELLTWLSRQLVQSGYDLRHIMTLIMNSQAYQRVAHGENLDAEPEMRFFASPDRRRLTAEQIVDSLFASSGHPLQVEELTFDSDSRRPAETMINLGAPKRAWEFATLANERDRPSLSIPRAQMVADVLEAFGWNGSRQNALTDREDQPNVLQPGILTGGVVSTWITRASIDSELAHLALQSSSAQQLVESLFLRFLTRYPTPTELEQMVAVISPGFESRRIPDEKVVQPTPLPQLSTVSWTNHLRGEANEIMLEHERRARIGDPADPHLEPVWRECYEDVVWTLINSPEFVWIP